MSILEILLLFLFLLLLHSVLVATSVFAGILRLYQTKFSIHDAAILACSFFWELCTSPFRRYSAIFGQSTTPLLPIYKSFSPDKRHKYGVATPFVSARMSAPRVVISLLDNDVTSPLEPTAAPHGSRRLPHRSHQKAPLVIIDDDPVPPYPISAKEFIVIPDDQPTSTTSRGKEKVVVVLDDEDYESDATLPDSTGNTNRVSRKSRKTQLHDLPFNPPNLSSVYEAQYFIPDKKILLKVRDTVELNDGSEDYENNRKGDFFRINYIVHNLENDAVTLCGWRFRRNYYVHGMLPKKMNEVCMVLQVNDENPIGPLRQGMETVPVSSVYKKRNLIITNRDYPALSFREYTAFSSDGLAAAEHKKDIYRSDILVCRWVYISHVDNSTAISSGELRRFSHRECDPSDRARNIEYSIPDANLTRDWLGYLPWPTQQHSFGDAFAGAGGFSEGAAQAGVFVKWAFDHDPQALASYRLNRPETETILCKADQFIEIAAHSGSLHVVILQISPPCPTFSPAHTQPGPLDEENSSALIAVLKLIENVKPRVVTLEQTSGIVTHHPLWFQALVNMFTSAGYSLRWKVIPLDQLGAAQKRKRLIIIASCPGGVLPPFPPPSHGLGAPNHYTTIADALGPLARAQNVTHHDVHDAKPRNLRPYSWDAQLRGCITTDGGNNYHPDGKRVFTIRELALLQSLPINFEFGRGQGKTAIRKQIGNMVPPCAAKALIESVIKALDKEDSERNGENNGA